MSNVALKLPCNGSHEALRVDVSAILDRRDGRRMPINTLHMVMRRKGWGGWSYPSGWAPLCLEMGFYVYKGRTATGVAVTWVGLDQPGEVPVDEFVATGFVLGTADGQYFRRDLRDGTGPTYTALRSRARVWVSYAWAVRRIRELGTGTGLEVCSTHHMQ